jgi:hypothetical protein
MAHETIIGAVDQSIEEICKEFRSRPTLFYTILQRTLSERVEVLVCFSC